jgi:hypothetical protein
VVDGVLVHAGAFGDDLTNLTPYLAQKNGSAGPRLITRIV